MSGSYPVFGRFIRQPIASYDDGQPVSAWEAMVLRSNTQLLVASTPQQRVGWAAPALMAETTPVNTFWVEADANAKLRIWEAEFPITWVHSEWPCGLDVNVSALVGTEDVDDLELDVRIVPAFTAPGDDSITPVFQDTATSSGAETYATVSGVVLFTDRYDFDRYWTAYAVEEDGVVRQSRIALMRIECRMTVPANDVGILTGVSVREYACLP